MIVTFVSQCEKKAQKRTRRILDSFANRIGDSVWQTAITSDGLDMVAKLLRKTATKSTAVSCHRNRTSHTTELVWIIGNKQKFNEIGIVPVNSTKSNIMHKEWENPWEYLESIKIISAISALLHDIGKSNKLFQQKLRPSQNTSHSKADLFRHEWVSLKLFLWIIHDCKTDEEVFLRLEHLNDFLVKNTDKQFEKYLKSSSRTKHNYAPLDKLPPLAQWIAWLIVTHHRLPSFDLNYTKTAHHTLANNKRHLSCTTSQFFMNIQALEGWVLRQKDYQPSSKEFDDNWRFQHLVLHSPAWQKRLKRYAQKARLHPQLQQISASGTISNPLLLNLSRLILMVANHNYSALPTDSRLRVKGHDEYKDRLIANTDKKTKQANQALDEHLIGVAQYATQCAHALPIIQSALPSLKNHDTLARNTDIARFQWQNKAFKLCREYSEISQSHGFFCVNMSSTGCGKTIANARMAYALADQQKGSRFTIALGLRTLTLQTGYSLRRDLGLKDKQLAILVGGLANRQLFELNHPSEEENNYHGSESSAELVEEFVDSQFDINDYDNLRLGIITQSENAQKLLYSPVVTCTIDHLMQASEQLRGGHYIVPALRLLSSDLILDEPDDFSESDLPALSRLVHLTGLYGGRLILSSATLQPDQVQGLFTAYLEGRKIYNQLFNLPKPQIPCLWVDEHKSHIKTCADTHQHEQHYQSFLQERAASLSQQPIRRIGEILAINADTTQNFYATIASQLIPYILHYHRQHHFVENNKHISIGLIRMANINPLVNIALALYEYQHIPEDTHIHLCSYHSRQVLALRNHIETHLDEILNRKNNRTPTQCEAITKTMEQHPNAKHHIFVVLASPVCEVGRDHDYDWALVEPSSMRSLIQLSGRIKRHRPEAIANAPNVGIWDCNIRALKRKTIAFKFPGYESKEHLLKTHHTADLIRSSELSHIDARPRIIKPSQLLPDQYLSDLEHHVLAELMNNPDLNLVNAYWKNDAFNRQHTHLVRISPFRYGDLEKEYVMRPDKDKVLPYDLEQVKAYGIDGSSSSSYLIQYYDFKPASTSITPWLGISLNECLKELQQKLNINMETILQRFSIISLPHYQENDSQQTYYFHEYLGCWAQSN